MNKQTPKPAGKRKNKWGAALLFVVALIAGLTLWGAMKPVEVVEVQKEYKF